MCIPLLIFNITLVFQEQDRKLWNGIFCLGILTIGGPSCILQLTLTSIKYEEFLDWLKKCLLEWQKINVLRGVGQIARLYKYLSYTITFKCDVYLRDLKHPVLALKLHIIYILLNLRLGRYDIQNKIIFSLTLLITQWLYTGDRACFV